MYKELFKSKLQFWIKNLNKDFEVIVIDDFSKDDSREKIKRYNKINNFKSIFNKKILVLRQVQIKQF